MKYKYGIYSTGQVEDYKKNLHKKIHWALLYVDPKTCDKFKYVDVSKYLEGVLFELDGFNSILNSCGTIISLSCILEKARLEVSSECFDFNRYRGLILDSHTLVDKLPELEV